MNQGEGGREAGGWVAGGIWAKEDREVGRSKNAFFRLYPKKSILPFIHCHAVGGDAMLGILQLFVIPRRN